MQNVNPYEAWLWKFLFVCFWVFFCYHHKQPCPQRLGYGPGETVFLLSDGVSSLHLVSFTLFQVELQGLSEEEYKIIFLENFRPSEQDKSYLSMDHNKITNWGEKWAYQKHLSVMKVFFPRWHLRFVHGGPSAVPSWSRSHAACTVTGPDRKDLMWPRKACES